MKILKVEISNFRQYRGDIAIDFSTDSKKHITIIQGNNGFGKSNVMNAITWCLYGEEMFKSKNNDGMKLINTDYAHELNMGEEGHAIVAVTIGEGKPEYRFERNAAFVKIGSIIKEGSTTFIGQRITTDKGYERISEPEWYVDHQFVPYSLRNFFFFDGEKMDQYFEDTEKIMKYIEELAQINTLNNTLDTLKKVQRKITAEVKETKGFGNVDYLNYTSIEQDINRIESDNKSLNEELKEIDDDIKEIDKFLENNNNTLVKQLQKQRTTAENLQKSLTATISSNENTIKALLAEYMPRVFAARALMNAKDVIEENTKKGVLPPNIKDVFLQDLLDSGVCICGRSLDESPECRKNLEQLLLTVVPDSIAQSSISGRTVVINLLDKLDFREAYRSCLNKIRDAKRDLEPTVVEIAEISKKLAAFQISDINLKEKRRAELLNRRAELNQQIGANSSKIISLNHQLGEKKSKIEEFKRQNARAIAVQKEREKVNALVENFENIKKTLMDEVRSLLEEKTRRHFFKLVSIKETMFKDVYIVDRQGHYSISVLNKYGEECLGSLSAAEKQSLALAFTAALFEVSGYNVPIFIDTPMGRVSKEPRVKIANNLPNYLSETQLIILPTDTEYTDEIRNILLPYVGKEYRISYDTAKTSSKVVHYE